MLQHYRGDYVIALTSLFPDVTFERGQFTLVPSTYTFVIVERGREWNL